MKLMNFECPFCHQATSVMENPHVTPPTPTMYVAHHRIKLTDGAWVDCPVALKTAYKTRMGN